MRTWIAGLALAAIPTWAHADTLTVYKYVDALGRVTYTNIAPKQGEDFDEVQVEYDAPGHAAASPARLKASIPRGAAERVAERVVERAEETVLLPSLRLAAVGREPPMRPHRKAPTVVTLRL